jgi:hypothetical protein
MGLELAAIATLDHTQREYGIFLDFNAQRKLTAAVTDVGRLRALGEEAPQAIEAANFDTKDARNALLSARLADGFLPGHFCKVRRCVCHDLNPPSKVCASGALELRAGKWNLCEWHGESAAVRLRD